MLSSQEAHVQIAQAAIYESDVAAAWCPRVALSLIDQ